MTQKKIAILTQPIGANRYSNTFGKSELSQGMLLFTLSKYKK